MDARGLMGALSLGAEGVYMGTRFMATKECPTHPNVKQAVLEATDTSTMAIRHGNPVPVHDPKRGSRGFVEERRGSVRLLLNDYMRSIIAERGGHISYEDATKAPGESDPLSQSNRTVEAFVKGNLKDHSITVGQGAGMIKDVPTCRELIERIVGETDRIMERLNSLSHP